VCYTEPDESTMKQATILYES